MDTPDRELLRFLYNSRLFAIHLSFSVSQAGRR